MMTNIATNFENVVTYQPKSSIRYVVETDQTRLIDEQRGLSWSLQGGEATIWDLLNSGYPYQKIVHFISLLSDLSVVNAEKVVLTALRTWAAQGILEIMLSDQSDS